MRCEGFAFRVEGMGCVILEWRDEVRLGIMRLLSAWSRVAGRSLVRGRVKEVCAVREGAMFASCLCARLAVYKQQMNGVPSSSSAGCK